MPQEKLEGYILLERAIDAVLDRSALLPMEDRVRKLKQQVVARVYERIPEEIREEIADKLMRVARKVCFTDNREHWNFIFVEFLLSQVGVAAITTYLAVELPGWELRECTCDDKNCPGWRVASVEWFRSDYARKPEVG